MMKNFINLNTKNKLTIDLNHHLDWVAYEQRRNKVNDCRLRRLKSRLKE